MANIDKGFTVDLISLKDEVLVTTSTSDPTLIGYEAPVGSLLLYQNGPGSTLFIKTNTPDTSWSTALTSVGIIVPSIFNTSGSPLTSNGNITISLEEQPANVIFAGPSVGNAVPTFRALNFNDIPLELYNENISSPTNAIASGTNSVAIGNDSQALSTNSVAIGSGTVTRLLGQRSFGGGKFATAGDAQTGMYTLRAITTNNTTTQMFLDGASQHLLLPDNSVFTFVIYVVARRTDTTGGAASYKFEGVILKNTTSGSTNLLNSSRTIIDETNGTWNCTIQANTTYGALQVNVTGENGKTIRWVATVITTEVTN